MKDTTKMNITNETGDEQDASRDDPLGSSTPQQRKTILKGLRILARVAIRSYMREQGEQAQDEKDSEEGG